MIYGRIYGFFLTRFGNYVRAEWTFFGYYPPSPRPHCTFETRGISRAPSELFFCYYPLSRSASEISVFFWIPLGQPCIRYGANNYTFNISTNNNLSLSEYTFFTSHRILMQQCYDNLIKYGISYPCLRSRDLIFLLYNYIFVYWMGHTMGRTLPMYIQYSPIY